MKLSGNSARRAVQALGNRGKTTRIPDDVRAVVLAYVDEARAVGQTWDQIGKAVGLSGTVVQRWNRARHQKGRFSKKGTLKPVVITPTTSSVSSSGIVLRTTTGEQLEGLGVEEAIRIVRGLR